MRIGGSDFKDNPDIFLEEAPILDWVNLPPTAKAVSLWDCLHDAQIHSIRSDLLKRTMDLLCEIEHLREFHKLASKLEFILHLEGLQSARVVRYAIWPGGCSIPTGSSADEQRRIVAEYQSKWREESSSWTEFESSIKRENEQVFDISDAAITASSEGAVALKISGHVNHAAYHEVNLRFDALRINGSDGREFELEEFLRLGESYWAAFSARGSSTS